jgi:hypothetical protein
VLCRLSRRSSLFGDTAKEDTEEKLDGPEAAPCFDETRLELSPMCRTRLSMTTLAWWGETRRIMSGVSGKTGDVTLSDRVLPIPFTSALGLFTVAPLVRLVLACPTKLWRESGLLDACEGVPTGTSSLARRALPLVELKPFPGRMRIEDKTHSSPLRVRGRASMNVAIVAPFKRSFLFSARRRQDMTPSARDGVELQQRISTTPRRRRCSAGSVPIITIFELCLTEIRVPIFSCPKRTRG